ncbi:hypothetical protein L2Y96_19195 [Luteibacter aegosomaticola]|uniref:hypothetical protein n=1 Tax=Luteibacter aegosomaticola TaxID=2911538 RepID=UPI001FF92F59|nr:hypothetical protein [Luteibacter aegosomaticola]UPG89499.1 hypothetical protein L2Y96_19195 [Luteibacter aegosomaticola]
MFAAKKTPKAASAVNGPTRDPNPRVKYSYSMLLKELSEAMKWVQERSVTLGAIALGTTTWLWLDFSAKYGLGIGVFSGSVLGALPSLLLCSVLLCIGLTLAFLMPTALLLVPVGEGRPKLIDLDTPKRLNATDRNVLRVPKRSAIRWMVITCLQVALISGATFVPLGMSYFKGSEDWAIFLFLVTAVAFPSAAFAKWVGGNQSFDFQALIVGSMMAQFQLSVPVALWVIPFVLGDDRAVTFANGMKSFIAVALVAGPLSGAQVVLIGLFRSLAARKNIVLRSLFLAQGLLVVVAAIAPLGARLLYIPIQIMGMNGMKCAVLPIVATEKEKIPAILRSTHSGTTVELSFVTPVIDEYRFVRAMTLDPDTTVAIPKSAVGLPVSCPEDQKIGG